MNNNYSANLRFIKHFRLSNPESKAIDKKKVTETYSANLRFIKHFRLSNPESKAIDKKKVMAAEMKKLQMLMAKAERARGGERRKLLMEIKWLHRNIRSMCI